MFQLYRKLSGPLSTINFWYSDTLQLSVEYAKDGHISCKLIDTKVVVHIVHELRIFLQFFLCSLRQFSQETVGHFKDSPDS